MSATRYEVRPGVYYDSVILMQLQKALSELPGVMDAGAVMATPANCELMEVAGFDLTGIDAKADDLLIGILAKEDRAAAAAIEQVDALLQRRSSKTAGAFRPHSLAGALDYLPQSSWALVSVPGRYAAQVAHDALDLGQNVFLYSDNVTVESELALKQKARELGLLMMGPDCGTAIIDGIGFGFANRVRRGTIGLVAASGTGLQAVTAGIHNAGGGVSQAIGTGGRDLKADIGGVTTLQALDLLGRDEATEVVVVISKPIDVTLATTIVAAAKETGKPAILNLLGYPPPGRRIGNLYFTATLQETAELAVSLGKKNSVSNENQLSQLAGEPYLRGLFSGGTLAYEVLIGLQTFLAPLYSNIPLRPEQKLADNLVSKGHTILDLGEDEFTQGRLHPMIDNDLRLRRLRQETADEEVGLILLDVVLGEGAHPDPAAELAPAIAEVKAARDIQIVALLLGTDEDPQDLDKQRNQLANAGAHIVRTASEAVEIVSLLLAPAREYVYPPVSESQFGGAVAAINVGLESFYDSLVAQGAQAVHVEWRPPAGGKENLMAILARLKDS